MARGQLQLLAIAVVVFALINFSSVEAGSKRVISFSNKCCQQLCVISA